MFNLDEILKMHFFFQNPPKISVLRLTKSEVLIHFSMLLKNWGKIHFGSYQKMFSKLICSVSAPLKSLVCAVLDQNSL